MVRLTPRLQPHFNCQQFRSVLLGKPRERCSNRIRLLNQSGPTPFSLTGRAAFLLERSAGKHWESSRTPLMDCACFRAQFTAGERLDASSHSNAHLMTASLHTKSETHTQIIEQDARASADQQIAKSRKKPLSALFHLISFQEKAFAHRSMR